MKRQDAGKSDAGRCSVRVTAWEYMRAQGVCKSGSCGIPGQSAIKRKRDSRTAGTVAARAIRLGQAQPHHVHELGPHGSPMQIDENMLEAAHPGI